MPSSYTQSLRLILPVTGELTGTWGDAVNVGLTELVEDAIAGTAAIAMANANVTLTAANEAADQARNMFLNLTGANTAQRDVIVPAVSKLYFVHNGTTGGFGVQVKTAAGAGFIVPNGARAALYCDGTNVVVADGTLFGTQLKNAADAAAARTTLDVPSRSGDNATGTWGINVTGNAATATTAANVSRSVTGAGLATGGGALSADQTITVAKATQAQAEAGADDATAMTPLLTAQAITARAPAIGVGQTWQNVLASRVQDTAYQNTTGKPIQVAIGADAQDDPRSFQVSSDGSTWVLVGRFAENTNLRENNVFAIIPPGWYYKVVGPASITHWAELR